MKNRTYGEYWKKGDTVGCLIDLEESTLTFSLNGIIFQTAFSLPKWSQNIEIQGKSFSLFHYIILSFVIIFE